MQQHGLLQKPTHGGVSVEGREKQQENYQSFTYCKNNVKKNNFCYRMQHSVRACEVQGAVAPAASC